MKKIECVIFDMDGTLTQTNELIFATFNHVTRHYTGKEYTPSEIIGMFGPPEEVALERLIGKERIDEAMELFHRFYETNHLRLANAYAGIRDILEYLDTNSILLAVFTGKGKQSALITLEHLGIKDHFDLIVTGSDVVNHKPSADGIRMVMERFGLEPHQVLMVGDAVSDVKASREAGVSIAAVLWDSYGKDHVLGMDVEYFFHSVDDFAAWIKSAIPGNGDARQ